MNLKVWVLVGDANARKSSAIRGLTGAGQRKPDWRLGLVNHPEVRAFIELGAPQERRPNPLPPADFVAMVNAETKGTASTHLVMPLRHDRTSICPYDALAYLDYFVHVANWEILGLCLLGNGRAVAPFYPYDPNVFAVRMDRPPYDAPNIIARQIRARWNFA